MKSSRKNKTKKKNRTLKKNTSLKAVCVLVGDKSNVKGIIKFSQINHKVKINYHIEGLSNGLHGFHVHEYGDLTDGCTSSCSHFNPFNVEHGGPKSKTGADVP